MKAIIISVLSHVSCIMEASLTFVKDSQFRGAVIMRNKIFQWCYRGILGILQIVVERNLSFSENRFSRWFQYMSIPRANQHTCNQAIGRAIIFPCKRRYDR